MEQLEKVEKLRQRANVTYEEAKQALEACGWDLLDAMVYLEKQGKVKEPSQSTYSTSYEEQSQYISVKEKVENQKNPGDGAGEKLKRLLKKAWQKSRDNYFCVRHKEEEIIRVPVWTFVIALLFLWEILVIIMIVALFFDCHYYFAGKDDCDKINHVMEKANDLADKVKDEYEKL